MLYRHIRYNTTGRIVVIDVNLNVLKTYTFRMGQKLCLELLYWSNFCIN